MIKTRDDDTIHTDDAHEAVYQNASHDESFRTAAKAFMNAPGPEQEAKLELMSSISEQPIDDASIPDAKGEHMAAGKRVFRDLSETSKKLTVLVPVETDEQLRRVAVRTGKNVGALIRGWIEKELKETVW